MQGRIDLPDERVQRRSVESEIVDVELEFREVVSERGGLPRFHGAIEDFLRFAFHEAGGPARFRQFVERRAFGKGDVALPQKAEGVEALFARVGAEEPVRFAQVPVQRLRVAHRGGGDLVEVEIGDAVLRAEEIVGEVGMHLPLVNQQERICDPQRDQQAENEPDARRARVHENHRGDGGGQRGAEQPRFSRSEKFQRSAPVTGRRC